MRVDAYENAVEAARDEAAKQGIYAVIRVEDNLEAIIGLLNGKPQQKEILRLRGMGISGFTEDGLCALGSTDILDTRTVRSLVKRVAETARKSAEYGDVQRNNEVYKLSPLQAEEPVHLQYSLEAADLSVLESQLMQAHQNIREMDKKLSLDSTYMQNDQQWWIARSDGTDVKFTIPMSVVRHTMTKAKGDVTRGSGVRHVAYDATPLFPGHEKDFLEQKVNNSYKFLVKLLDAELLPAGHYKAILTPNFSGVYTHEAVGHAIESDGVSNSVLGKDGKANLGEKVAQANIDVIDGPVEGMWGNLKYSMNGVPRQTVTFIKNGVLVDSLSDVYTASRAGTSINGAGRAEHFLHPAIPRMSCTRIVDNNAIDIDVHPDYMTPQEVYQMLDQLGEFKEGEPIVMPVEVTGGQVMPEVGSFMFNCRGIYLFDPKGKEKVKLYGASSFGGSILGALKTPMQGIGKDLMLDDGGFCGKSGQHAWVSDGSHPYMILGKTKAVTFGGQ